MPKTIVLVDDDRDLLTVLGIVLEDAGFSVISFLDGIEALQALAIEPVDLAIVDMKMPRMAGTVLLRRLRESSALPVIILTAMTDQIDEALALRMGADDYLKKPVSPRLLVERVRALLRRSELPRKLIGNTELPIQRGDLRLDEACHRCTWKGSNVDLTVSEFSLVMSLARRPDYVRSRDQLMDSVFGEKICVNDRTIDVHVKRLRKKFRSADPEFAQIETLYGIGYRFKGA
jgi:two-component system, OmpR family, response regulator ChvI